MIVCIVDFSIKASSRGGGKRERELPLRSGLSAPLRLYLFVFFGMLCTCSGSFRKYVQRWFALLAHKDLEALAQTLQYQPEAICNLLGTCGSWRPCAGHGSRAQD